MSANINPATIRQHKPTPKKPEYKTEITLNSNNKTLAIGMPNFIGVSSQMGFVYTNPQSHKTSIFLNGTDKGKSAKNAEYITASPANQGTYDLRGTGTKTTVEVGSLHPNEKESKTSIVKADGNDKIKLGNGTTIGEVTEDENGMVSIQFVNTRADKEISNIVTVVAKKEDMLTILENSVGLPEDEQKGLIDRLNTKDTLSNIENCSCNPNNDGTVE
jgi:hypothetical protein